jgi:hypothetical protein
MSAFMGRADTAEYSIVCSATLETHSQKLVTEYMYYRKSLYRGLLRTFEIRGNHGEVNVFQKFSKVLNTLTLYSRYTRALPFEEHLIIMERKRISKVLKSPESSKVHKSPQFSVVDILGHWLLRFCFLKYVIIMEMRTPRSIQPHQDPRQAGPQKPSAMPLPKNSQAKRIIKTPAHTNSQTSVLLYIYYRESVPLYIYYRESVP